MAIQKTEAFVLKTQPFRSSSLIITFYSKTFGKLKGIAKGVRREREVRGAIYELFTHLEIVFYEKLRSDLHLVSDAAILESFDPVRSRLETIAYGSYFAELVDRVCEVHDPHEGIFDLLDFSFRFLPSVPLEKLARIFEIKLLREIGWIPFLDSCLKCSEQHLDRPFFSFKQGAVFCHKCARAFPDASALSVTSLQALRFFSRHSTEQSLKHHTAPTVDRELHRLMELFILYRLGTPLNSRRFMEKIKPVLADQSRSMKALTPGL